MSIILCTCSFHYRILDFEPNQCRQFHLDGHNQRPVQHTAGSSSQVHTWDSLDIHLCLCVNVATSHCDRPDQTSVPPYSSGMSGNKGTEQGQLACLAQTLHQVLGQSTVRKVMVLQKVYLNNVFPFWTKCDEEKQNVNWNIQWDHCGRWHLFDKRSTAAGLLSLTPVWQAEGWIIMSCP